MATDIQLHKQQAQELSNKLWAIANDLRGTMDASKFKDYIVFFPKRQKSIWKKSSKMMV